ncbi:MAG: hypothetical protein C4617_01170 [Candidatus Liberibacter europaeus]|uniref:Uncharacterized protein n=1 Tax=Candidatus Liberibacter europaeus TaxID=744859 RepID=A0A2T4VZ30_9HYPH|nr:hypothetical protein [Candidatus Liberibacter europaeus]PTL87042.1 MAG: hypothetical protein C4617_01170 [Candidatus Liberibacter europaeus]
MSNYIYNFQSNHIAGYSAIYKEVAISAIDTANKKTSPTGSSISKATTAIDNLQRKLLPLLEKQEPLTEQERHVIKDSNADLEKITAVEISTLALSNDLQEEKTRIIGIISDINNLGLYLVISGNNHHFMV